MDEKDQIQNEIVEILYRPFAAIREKPLDQLLPQAYGYTLLPADYVPPLKFWEYGFAMSYSSCLNRIITLIQSAISFDKDRNCLTFDEQTVKNLLKDEKAVVEKKKKSAELLAMALDGKEGEIFLCLMLLWEIKEKSFAGAWQMEHTLLKNIAHGCDIHRKEQRTSTRH